MTAATELSAAQINLGDPEIFIRNEAHDLFRTLRREAPVHWSEPSEGNPNNGFWSITKYHDLVSVSRQPNLFISSRGITMGEQREGDADPDADLQGGIIGMLIMTDPPAHVRLRRLISKGFTPRSVVAMEDHIRQITSGILDDVDGKPGVDFVTEISAQLPLAVICGMMGVPKKDWPLMFELTNKVLGGADPEYQGGGDGSAEATRATIQEGAMQLFNFFREVVEERRNNPGEDLVSVLLGSEIEGEKLDDMDILLFCALLILAGNETTRNAISGGMLALDEHPAEKQKVAQNPELIDSAVEEILRWTSPVAHMARVSTADTEVGGQAIKEGQRLVMWYPSVNRDEDIFDDPYRFDVARSPNEHLAFGIGEHFCLGAGFARAEIKLMFQELLRRHPNIHVDGEVERLRSNFIAGIKHLPVALG